MTLSTASRLPTVAVVILNYNGEHFLRLFLPSVLSTTYPNAHLIVADNASTDSSLELLRNEWGFVPCDTASPADRTYICLSENFGFADGYNMALEPLRHKYDYYVLLNSDVEVPADWLEPVIRLMETDPSIAVAQPKLLYYEDKEQFEYAGAAGGFIDTLGYPFCRGRIFASLEYDRGQYDQSIDIFWASGAAMFVRAELFHRLGGFDGDYFAHMEEIDFCWRVKRAGYRVLYCPESRVWHVGGGTLPKENPRKTFLNFRNSLVSVFKNVPKRKMWFLLIVRLIMDSIAILRFLVRREWRNASAVVAANWAFVLRFGTYLRKRRHYRRLVLANLNPHPNAYKDAGWYRGSIVWAHFIRSKQTWQQLYHKH